jgi:hypothetical protein
MDILDTIYLSFPLICIFFLHWAIYVVDYDCRFVSNLNDIMTESTFWGTRDDVFVVAISDCKWTDYKGIGRKRKAA